MIQRFITFSFIVSDNTCNNFWYAQSLLQTHPTGYVTPLRPFRMLDLHIEQESTNSNGFSWALSLSPMKIEYPSPSPSHPQCVHFMLPLQLLQNPLLNIRYPLKRSNNTVLPCWISSWRAQQWGEGIESRIAYSEIAIDFIKGAILQMIHLNHIY